MAVISCEVSLARCGESPPTRSRRCRETAGQPLPQGHAARRVRVRRWFRRPTARTRLAARLLSAQTRARKDGPQTRGSRCGVRLHASSPRGAIPRRRWIAPALPSNREAGCAHEGRGIPVALFIQVDVDYRLHGLPPDSLGEQLVGTRAAQVGLVGVHGVLHPVEDSQHPAHVEDRGKAHRRVAVLEARYGLP